MNPCDYFVKYIEGEIKNGQCRDPGKMGHKIQTNKK
jgi:hypothetical protein